MLDTTLTSSEAHRFYDWLGERHDMGTMFERQAKAHGLHLLNVQPGHRVLNVGAGTGKDNVSLLSAAGTGGLVVAADLSMVMLRLGRMHARKATCCQAEAAVLPFRGEQFDRILATYLLDLLPVAILPCVLAEMARLLRPEGRLVIVSLTEGVDTFSRALIAAWKAAFRVHPLACGGCRPLELMAWLRPAGLTVLQRDVVVQLGVPSEVVLAERARTQ